MECAIFRRKCYVGSAGQDCNESDYRLFLFTYKRMVNHTMYSDDDDSQEDQYVNYKQKYRELKKNLRYLIYENECFQDELRKAQHNFVSISRDKSFLLDRILKYEKPQGPSSDSEATESSDEDEEASEYRLIRPRLTHCHRCH